MVQIRISTETSREMAAALEVIHASPLAIRAEKGPRQDKTGRLKCYVFAEALQSPAGYGIIQGENK